MIKRLIIAIILLTIVVGGIVGFNIFRANAIKGFFASRQPEPVAVSTIEVVPATWYPGIEAIGTARAAQGVDLGVETAGIVKEILFNANDSVALNQRLVQIDDMIERADLEAANASLNLSRTQLARAETLKARGVSATTDVDEAQAAETSAQAEVVKLTAIMNQKSLEAPFAGVVGIPQIDVGEYVVAGTVYTTLQDLDTMRVDFSVPEQQIRLIEMGLPVTVTSEVGTTSLTGEVSAIEPKIDPNTRLVTIRAAVHNPDNSVNPGQFMRVRVELPTEEGVISLPQTVVSSNLYGDSVFVVRTEGEGDAAKRTVEQVFVRIGRRSGNQIEILQGLKPGDVVVTAGQNRLSGGAPVTIDNTVNPATANPPPID